MVGSYPLELGYKQNTFMSEQSKKYHKHPLQGLPALDAQQVKTFWMNEVITEWLVGMFATSYTAELLLSTQW